MSRPSYTLASLMLLMVLFSLFLGVSVRWPHYGIVFVFLSIPALARTIWINGRRKAAGHGLYFGEKIVTFAGSVGVVIAAAGLSLATVAALVAFAIALPAPSAVVFPAVLCSGIIGGLIGLVVLVKLWPPYEERGDDPFQQRREDRPRHNSNENCERTVR